MFFWNQVPLLRLLIPFIIGIYSAIQFNKDYPAFKFLLILIFLFLLFFTFLKKLKYGKQWIYGFLLNSAIFFSGYLITISDIEISDKSHFSKQMQKPEMAVGRVIKPVVIKEKTVKVIAEIEEIYNKNHWQNCEGKVILWIKKDSASEKIEYGDLLLLNSVFSEIKLPQNPEEFNYKRYLSFRNIYHQAYIKNSQWKLIARNKGNFFVAFAIKLQKKILNVFKENKIEGKEYAVVSALVAGNTDNLDTETLKAFSDTGTMHILSVSGLHVGIIYYALSLMLFFLNRKKYGNIIRVLILISFLWLYAFITGLSPAVLRAAAMLSFVIIGKSLNRDVNIYNTIAASAFLLLIINPFNLADVGFQLSYLAVAGIVFIEPYINNVFVFKNKIADIIWKMISVSIAAQIATFPLGMFYFHQFPNYFLISNLIVIPISTVVIYLAIAVIVLSPFQIISFFLAKAMAFLTFIMNSVIFYIEHLPFSKFYGIYLSLPETLILFLTVSFILAFIILKRPVFANITLTLFAVFLLFILTERFENLKKKEFAVYSINKTSAIGFVDKNKNILLSDFKTNGTANFAYHLANHWNKTGYKEPDTTINFSGDMKYFSDNFFIHKNFIQYYDKKIILVDSNSFYFSGNKNISFDYAVITGNPKIKIKDVISKINTKEIIIDSSNSLYKTKKWIEECKKLKIACHAVSFERAFVIEL
ncbi:MAG: ComEC/Rec2 family competence protein [Bacteroidales bacterium]|nr:ComEC/Rec2 family competence protein [Bacteroidales bacterium]